MLTLHDKGESPKMSEWSRGRTFLDLPYGRKSSDPRRCKCNILAVYSHKDVHSSIRGLWNPKLHDFTLTQLIRLRCTRHPPNEKFPPDISSSHIFISGYRFSNLSALKKMHNNREIRWKVQAQAWRIINTPRDLETDCCFHPAPCVRAECARSIRLPCRITSGTRSYVKSL